LVVAPAAQREFDLAAIRSPLLWDVFAVSTYFTVSLLFWYMAYSDSQSCATGQDQNSQNPLWIGRLGWTVQSALE